MCQRIATVIHFKALVTHSSPESLYVVESVSVINKIHSSPIYDVFRVTSELDLQLVMYQYDIPLAGDEWMTSEVK